MNLVSTFHTQSPFRRYLVVSGFMLPLYMVSGFLSMFSTLKFYDDIGAMLIQINEYNSHKILYDQVYSPYGPFHVQFYYIVYCFGTLTATHDRIGLFVLFMWILCALLAGSFSVSITGHASLGIFGQILSFFALQPLEDEPGHPVSLCILLLTAIVVFVQIACRSRCSTLYFLMAGMMAGLLCATKINIGVLSLIALLSSLLTFSGGRGRMLFCVACVMLVFLPYILVRTAWSDLLCREFATVLVAGLIPCLLAVFMIRKSLFSWGPFFAVLGGSIFSLTCSLGFSLMAGTTFPSLLNAILFRALLLGRIFSVEPPLNPTITIEIVVISAVSTTCILIFSRLTARHKRLVKRLLAYVLLGLVCHIIIISTLHDHQGIFYCLMLFWAVVWNPIAFKDGPTHETLYCVSFVCILGICETLSGYPVFGSQTCVPGYLISLSAPYALSKCLNLLPSPILRRRKRNAFLLQTTFMLSTLGEVSFLIISGITYERNYALNLPGSHLFRIDQLTQATYSSLAYNLDHFYSGFISVPGVNSFYLWSRHLPPTGLNTTANYSVLTSEEQERIISAIQREIPFSAILNMRQLHYWSQGRSVADSPLYQFVINQTRPYARVENFELRTPPQQEAIPVDYCAMYLPEWIKTASPSHPTITICCPLVLTPEDRFFLVNLLSGEEWKLDPPQPGPGVIFPPELRAGSHVFTSSVPDVQQSPIDWNVFIVVVKSANGVLVANLPFFRPPN